VFSVPADNQEFRHRILAQNEWDMRPTSLTCYPATRRVGAQTSLICPGERQGVCQSGPLDLG